MSKNEENKSISTLLLELFVSLVLFLTSFPVIYFLALIGVVITVYFCTKADREQNIQECRDSGGEVRIKPFEVPDWECRYED